jgi:hypothetical protein
MTEVNLNETVNGYRGSIGRLVFKKYKGRTIVGRKPVNTKPPTPAQTAQREQFKEASSFAKFAMEDPALRAFYGPIAQQRDITLYALAMGDYLKKPYIKPLDLTNYKGRVGDTHRTRQSGRNRHWLGLLDLHGHCAGRSRLRYLH